MCNMFQRFKKWIKKRKKLIYVMILKTGNRKSFSKFAAPKWRIKILKRQLEYV